MIKHEFIAMIPCAGTGTRYGEAIPKQYTQLNGKTVLDYTLAPFINSKNIKDIVLIANVDDIYIDVYQRLSPKITIKRVGSKMRAQTVRNGLDELKCLDLDWVLVHDAARCCLSVELLDKMINSLQDDNVGGILACKATDTIKLANSNNLGAIAKTLDRRQIYLAQTPQMFRYHILQKALNQSDLTQITDEASAVEGLGLQVKIVESSSHNIKVTHPVDRYIAEAILAKYA